MSGIHDKCPKCGKGVLHLLYDGELFCSVCGYSEAYKPKEAK